MKQPDKAAEERNAIKAAERDPGRFTELCEDNFVPAAQ